MAARAHFQKLVEKTRMQAPLQAAVVYPCDRESLQLALSGAFAGYLAPTLVGPESRIRDLAGKFGLDISRLAIVDTPDVPRAAGIRAVELAREGLVSALVKGSLSNEDLLSPVAAHDSGLRTDRRLSHAFFLDLPGISRGLLLADAQLNVSPNLAAKKDIVLNTVQLAISLGLAAPNVALLAAMDGPAPAFPSTTDARRTEIDGGPGNVPRRHRRRPADAGQRVVRRCGACQRRHLRSRRARRCADRAVDGIGADGAAHADGVQCAAWLRELFSARASRSSFRRATTRWKCAWRPACLHRSPRPPSASGRESQAGAGSSPVVEANSKVAA